MPRVYLPCGFFLYRRNAMLLNSYSLIQPRNIGIWNNLGDVLLVGEGNLSFAKSLAVNFPHNYETMLATIYEGGKEISDEAVSNAAYLRLNGCDIRFNIDATKLGKQFNRNQFDTIIFQFPNAGSRESKYGHHQNHILIRNLLRSAKPLLTLNGKVMITIVDDNHYKGQFKFDEAAHFAGYKSPETYPFDPKMFRGYSHTNTNDDESAIEKYDLFATWVFRV